MHNDLYYLFATSSIPHIPSQIPVFILLVCLFVFQLCPVIVLLHCCCCAVGLLRCCVVALLYCCVNALLRFCCIVIVALLLLRCCCIAVVALLLFEIRVTQDWKMKNHFSWARNPSFICHKSANSFLQINSVQSFLYFIL